MDQGLKPSQGSNFNFALLSHKGWVRANNEDRMVAREFQTIDNEQPVLSAVLCDGVGGHQGGEVAAQIGADAVIDHIAGIGSLQDPPALLREAVESANQAILDAYDENPELEGMASTCVAVLIINDRLYLANLGDSRAYLLRKGELFQLNYDHTWLEDTIGKEFGARSGISRDHPLAHVLSRHLGSPQPLQVDLRIRSIGKKAANEVTNQGMTLRSGDRLLLCSDGMTDLHNDEQIGEKMNCRSPRKDAQMLVLSALEKGGHDNTSVIVVHL